MKILCCAVTTAWLMSIIVLQAAPKNSEERKLQVMTYNIRYQNNSDKGARAWTMRLPILKKGLNTLAPEILALQEAMTGQVQDLRTALPHHKMIGCGREDGKKLRKSMWLYFMMRASGE